MEHRFFHADCFNRLQPNLQLTCDAAGLSVFGRFYAGALQGHKPVQTWNAADHREVLVERVRQMHSPYRLSRFGAFFAALTVDGAIRYTGRFRPSPGAPIASEVKIYEVFSRKFEVLDMHWLDIDGVSNEVLVQRYRDYWKGCATADSFGGEWREPLMEGLLASPVRVGEVVATIRPVWTADAALGTAASESVQRMLGSAA